MNTRIASAILMLALFASPFAVIAQEVPVEEATSEPASELILEEPLVGEILATSTVWVFETEEEAPSVTPEAVSAEETISETVELIDPDTYVPGELIVVFEDTPSESDVQEVADTPSVDSIETLTEDGTIALIETDESIEEVIAELEASPGIAYVEPNYVRTVQAFSAWSIDTIDATEAWTVATGTDVVIAVIDTGVDYTHPEFAGRMWDGSNCVASTSIPIPGGCTHGYDFADNDNDPAPEGAGSDYFHGTHVAGIAAGIAPGAKIMALRFGLTVSSEIEAIEFARANGARIINASYSGVKSSDSERDAIERFEAAGGLFIAAAANGAFDKIGDNLDSLPEGPYTSTSNAATAYPAQYSLASIVSVAATNQSDGLVVSSNFGENSVDLGAPGFEIRSTYPGGVFATTSGTSMAAPHVAGVVALLKQKFPSMSSSDIKERILTTGDTLPALTGKTVSGKRLNANRALMVDFKNPTVTLLGDNPMTLTAGNVFTDPGATALDDFDGDISANIVVSGTVDTNTVGLYPINYTAVDTAGNTSTSTRTVNIQAPQVSSGGGGGGGGSSKKKKEAQKKKEAEKKARAEARKKATAQKSATTNIVDPVRLPQSTGTVLGRSTSTPATTSYVFTLNLSLGSTGPEVTALQTKLATLGFLTVTPTGYFGALTQTAVMAYQRSKNIPALGIVGPMTRASLNSL